VKQEGAGEGSLSLAGREQTQGGGKPTQEEAPTAAGPKAEADSAHLQNAAAASSQPQAGRRGLGPTPRLRKGRQLSDPTAASRPLVLALVAILGVRET